MSFWRRLAQPGPIGGNSILPGTNRPLPPPFRNAPILALEILHAQFKREGRDLLFGARDGAFQGWSKAKEALDRRMLVALQNAHGEKAKLKEEYAVLPAGPAIREAGRFAIVGKNRGYPR